MKNYARKASVHWTAKSVADFVYRISSDFVIQIEKKMRKQDISHSNLATRMNVTPGRVSQLMNNPGNLKLLTGVQCARALGMKVALVAYEDKDPENQSGPISSEIFNSCWEKMGSPRDFFELDDCAVSIYDMSPYIDRADNTTFRREVLPSFSEKSKANTGSIMRIN